MTTTTQNAATGLAGPTPAASPPGAVHSDERNLWMPPRQMRRYQLHKAMGGLLILSIFMGWLVLMWSNPLMRVMVIVLIGLTLWVVVGSLFDDLRRSQGRQIEIINRQLTVTQPDGVTHVRLSDVAEAQWYDDEEPGLRFRNRTGELLVHLDTDFLTDQAEARSFLHWARQRTDLPFKVKWPS